jgi:histidyl-tRNA synthetase
MSSNDLSRLPGFRDFVPEDLAVRSHIFDAWRATAVGYGFHEYDGPPLESLDLYVEKSGEEIVSQLYNFVDKGDRPVAMRPEMTPSLARILAERSRAMPKPIRWFSIPQLFRYERQQRGRLREHFQWNVDVVGEEGVGADAEVLAVALDALRRLGLDEASLRARVSDRRLLSAVLQALGVSEERLLPAYGVIDKVEREDRARSAERLQEEAGVTAEQAEQILHLFDTPTLEAVKDRFAGDGEVMAEVARLDEYFALLEAMELGRYVEFDLTIVRGLAYYTGIVFEVFDRQGEFRAICGGGRYDRLLERVGGESLPAVGFGMGDVVLTELLRDRGLLPEVGPELDYFLVCIGDDTRTRAMTLAHRLRERGATVSYEFRSRAVRKQFKSAENAGAREVVVVGPDELAEGMVTVRDMTSGAERKVPLEELEAGA